MLMESTTCSTWLPITHNQHDLFVLHSPCKQGSQLRDTLTIDVIEQGERLTYASHASTDLWRVCFLIPVFDNGQHERLEACKPALRPGFIIWATERGKAGDDVGDIDTI